jgi:C4-dicarboxylate-binding protein DctP
VIVNRKFWDELPADIKTQLEKAMHDATAYGNRIAKDENERALEAVRKTGKTEIYTLTPEERLSWKKALVRVHKEQEGRIGKELIQMVYKDVGFDPEKL